MLRRTKEDIVLKDITPPDWMVDWAEKNPGEMRLLFLIFGTDSAIDTYFNNRYPENFWDFQRGMLDFKYYDWRDQEWDTYKQLYYKEKRQW